MSSIQVIRLNSLRGFRVCEGDADDTLRLSLKSKGIAFNNASLKLHHYPNPPFILGKGIELMPAIKPFTLAARQQKALGRRLRDIVDEVRDVDRLSRQCRRRNVIHTSTNVQNAKKPGIRSAQFNAKLRTVSVGDI